MAVQIYCEECLRLHNAWCQARERLSDCGRLDTEEKRRQARQLLAEEKAAKEALFAHLDQLGHSIKPLYAARRIVVKNREDLEAMLLRDDSEVDSKIGFRFWRVEP